MLNICSSVQDHNQSTIHKDSDWTSQRAKEFYLELKASGRMRLKKCVWRSASKETSLKKSSWRHVIRSKVIRSNGHQKHLARSYFTRVDKVQCTKCTTTNSITTISATLSLHQDKINSNIAADFVAFQVEWIWN